MKTYKLLTVLVIASVVIAACTKEPENTKLDPKISTSQYKNLTSDSVIVYGFIVSSGSGFSERGICYGLTVDPTTADNKVVYEEESTKSTFSVMINGLTRLTTYHARAYGINGSTTIYGDDMTITTPAALPVLANISLPTLTATTDKGVTCSTNIDITDDGGPDATADITKRGVVYSTSANPTITSSKTEEGTGAGAFTSSLENLEGNKTYYLRAYATNTIGTGYSNEISFTTPKTYATCTTAAPTAINKTTATFHGSINSNGGETISQSGFCYGLTADPTIADTKVVVTAVNNTLTAEITGLTANTTYHVRAFVTNSVGTNYGADMSFTTLANITKFWVVGGYNGWDNSDAALYIISTATDPESQGYINFTSTGAFKLTTDHSWDNAHTFGDDGTSTGKLANPGSDINVSAIGYYLIKANASAMTYSLTATTWGIIGDATAGGWGTQTDMAYNATTKLFTLAAHLTSGGGFKFRGTSDWSINYGSKLHDGNLDTESDNNIPVTITGDYAITMDLSHPNAYTYSANTWGLIGDATGSWSDDQNMTWDAVNHVFTITLDMVAGSYKFRANDAWDYALGGTSLSALDPTPGSANFSLADPGNYTVTLDPWGLVATITKN